MQISNISCKHEHSYSTNLHQGSCSPNPNPDVMLSGTPIKSNQFLLVMPHPSKNLIKHL